MKLSYSQIKKFKRCPQKWSYNYDEGLETEYNDVQQVGVAGHDILEQILKGYGLDEVESPCDDTEVNEFVLKLAKRWLKTNTIDNWEIIDVEKEFEVEVPETDITFRLRVDAIIKDMQTERIWILDHKFVKNDLNKWEDSAFFDEQANYYLWALRHLGYNIHGIMFNLIRTKLPREPELLKKGGLSKAKNMDTDAETYEKAVIENGLNIEDYREFIDFIRNNGKPFFKVVRAHRTDEELDRTEQDIKNVGKTIKFLRENNCIFRNADSTCNWCEYSELCLMEQKGIDADFFKETFKRKE